MDSESAWIEELATNNQMPSEEEVQEVKRLLIRPMKELETVDAEIAVLKKRISELESQRNATEKLVSQYQRILSPIRQVPPDVLGEIFSQCLPTHHNSIIKSSDCPLLLTHVCSQWRTVAIAFPRLWERLHITFTEDDTLPDLDTAADMVRQGFEFGSPEWPNALSMAKKERRIKSLRRRYDAVKEWFLRSGTRPLSLSISFPRQEWYTVPYSQRPRSVTMELLSFIGTLSSRIQDLELAAPSQIYEALAETVRSSEMIALTSLKINFPRCIFGRPTLSRPVSFVQPPNLRNVSFAGGHASLWRIRDPSFKTQWSKLTTLTCHDILTIDETLYILQNSPNLVHYKGSILEYTGHNSQPLFNGGQISLPFLRSLAIYESLPTQLLGRIYNHIDAPLLQTVSYVSASPMLDDHVVGVPMSILPFLRKSINLQKLYINTPNFAICDLGALLDTVPTITHLCVGPHGRDLSFVGRPSQMDYELDGLPRSRSPWSFRQLAVDHQSNNNDLPFLPCLTSLTISSSTAQIDADMLFDIVKSRLTPTTNTAALDHVEVVFYTEKTRDIAQELRSYAESLGVKISLDFHYPPPILPEYTDLHPEFGMNAQHGRTWPYIDADEDLSVSYAARRWKMH